MENKIKQMKSTPVILTESQIKLKIKRIAYEIAEHHYKTKELFCCSVGESANDFSTLLLFELKKIFTNKLNNFFFDTQKQKFIVKNMGIENLKKASIILLDDVMDTGKSMTDCLVKLMLYEPKTIEIAVLVNRKHTSYPLYPRYKGMELKTVLEDNIKICLDQDKEMVAYLYDNK